MFQRFLADHTPIDSIPSIYGFWGSFPSLTLFTFPYVLLQVRATFTRLDPSFDDAARSLGHGPWRTFLRTTLPLLRPSIVAGSLLSALYAISDFGVVTLLRYDTFTRAIYTQYRSSFNRSNAAVLALVLVLFAGSWSRPRSPCGPGRLPPGRRRSASATEADRPRPLEDRRGRILHGVLLSASASRSS